MCEITWDFMEPLDTDTVVDNFERDYVYKIPRELRVLIQEHNRAYPDKGIFDRPREGMIFSNLLSFNKDSSESVFFHLDAFKKENTLWALPFGTDGFGNLICEKNGNVFLWDHETGQMNFIAESVGDFLGMLHG